MKSFTEKLHHYFTNRFGFKKVLLLAGILSVSLFTFMLFLLVLVWAGAFGTLPDQRELMLIENPSASEVYSADSVLLGRYFIQERSNIYYADIPDHVTQAVIATEDIRFYDHHGIDLKSLGRVMIKGLLFQNKTSGGGSTITQQLAKNLYPRRKYLIFSLLINKMREMIIASRLESAHDKNAILTLYLNTIPFGDNTYGLEAAAQRFFSVPVNKLTIDQAAVLIGMLKATHHYNPRVFPEAALQRRNTVLAQMVKYRMLGKDKADSLQGLPIMLSYNKITHHTGLASYFREYIRPELLQWCSDYNEKNKTSLNLYTDGLKIYTTIDSRLQRYAEGAIAGQMAGIQKRFLTHWGNLDPWYGNPRVAAEAIIKSSHYQNLLEEGFTHDRIVEEMQTPVLMNMFTWDGEKEMMMSPVDSIEHYLKFLNAGILAIDPQHSAIRVWVGGINHSFFQYDHVRESTKRQVGSTFKPIVYAAALEQGLKPCAFISAEKTVYSNMEDWSPENVEDNYDLKYSMPGALAFSVNTVSVRVLEKAGIANVINLAQKMGITSPMKHVPSLALGTADISMMEMVSAYACFATNGKTVKPFYITMITTHQDEVLEKFIPAQQEQALSPESAQMILHMLRRAVNEGTSSSLRSQFGLRLDIAGKTGTTQSNADGWFIGITPKLVIGAWVGADNPAIRFRTTSLGQGARTALPIVGEFLLRVVKDKTRDSITQARFPALPASLDKKLSCDLYKTDNNLFRRFSGRTEIKKNFGEKRKGFLKRLFEKKEKG